MTTLKKGTRVRRGDAGELIPLKKKSTEQKRFEEWRETAKVTPEEMAKARTFAQSCGWQNPDDDVLAHILHAQLTERIADDAVDDANE